MLAASLVVVAACAAAASADPPPTVALLPLRPASGVTTKQAAGATALLRKELGAASFLKVVPSSDEDASTADKCGVQPACLAKAAFRRGADLLAGGTVGPAPTGLKITLVVVDSKHDEALRTVDAILGDDPAPVFDRLMRAAFAPDTLAGAIAIDGDAPGARVLIDGKDAGTMPLDGPVLGLVEGDHVVEAEQEGYQRFRRVVRVEYQQVATVKVVLLRALPASSTAGEEASPPPIPWGPIAVAGLGGACVATGAVLGALSLRDALDVEARAKDQLLVFPRDEGLMRRGQILAYSADAAYAMGALALGGAALWWVLTLPPAPPPPATPEKLEGPAPGAPTERDLSPALEGL